MYYVQKGKVFSGGSRISCRGRGPPTQVLFWQKCMQKRKNWVPWGEGAAPGTSPLDPPMVFTLHVVTVWSNTVQMYNRSTYALLFIITVLDMLHVVTVILPEDMNLLECVISGAFIP